MDKYLINLILITLINVSLAVKIIDLKVPEALKSGSEQNVVLDCEFEVDENDTTMGGLTVKWFYGGDTEMIYQWLPGNSPQAIGRLKDRVDLEYKASSDLNTMYRALKIKNLSPVLTGSYTCKVSSFATEDAASKTMIIYKTADGHSMDLDSEDKVLTCTAYGLYPEPEMKLYIRDSTNNTDPYNITRTVEKDETIGFYNITKVFYFTEDQLVYPETKFVCEIYIAGTQYSQEIERTYYPGGEPTTTESPQPDTTTMTPIVITENLAAGVLPSCLLTTTISLLCLLFTFK